MNRQRGRPNYYTSGKIWGPLFLCRLPEENMGFRLVVQVSNSATCAIKKSKPNVRLATGDYIVATQELFKIFILCIQWPILTASCSSNTEEILITLPGNQAAGNNRVYEPNSEQLCILQWVGRYCGINDTPSSSRYKVLSEVSNAHFAESWGLGLQHGSKNSSLLRMS